MADQRIKGQEVEVIVVVDNVIQSTITAVKSFETTWQLEQKEEGYLGETSDRFDEVFKGIKARLELHFDNEDVFNLVDAIISRAQRRTPGTKINIKATMNFPNGDRPRLIFPNVFFADIPMNFAGRTEYGTITLDVAMSTYKRIG